MGRCPATVRGSRLTEASAHLDPAATPSLRTYSAAAAAVAVGLFGTTVLMPLDPRLAQARRTRGPSGGGPSCGGGCGGT